MKKLIYLVLIMSTVISACTKDEKKVAQQSHPIISDQFKDLEFENDVPLFVAMFKLKVPPLLTTVQQNEQGKLVIDPGHASALEVEQRAMITELQAISSDIKVIFTYKMVLNALAVEAPQSLADKLSELDADMIEADERFAPPQIILGENDNTENTNPFAVNSMNFIGVDKIHQMGVKGQGMKVGIIDTGIDYTHSMLGGLGSAELFAGIDANKVSEHFPTPKVVGGRDFVGAVFNSGSHLYKEHVPKPDDNPIDQSGHGSHVAGTVAGIGDGVNTYDGAAPEAELYALKVFSDGGGSTSDTVVIAALEYAADPNADGDLSDQLDVVNLSLGGGFGKPHSLYNQAIGNLVDAGTLVVASAGNAGPTPNIVGSPSTADAAISVAASLDNMDHNYKFQAVEFATANNPKLLVEAVEGFITKKISDAGDVQGKLVYVGDAAADLSDEVLEALEGNVALIDRGAVTFVEKIQRAKGAIGIVMANNREGDSIRMGGEGEFEIPGVMITQAMGNILKEEMEVGDVTIKFLVEETIDKPELIDTLTSFSSQGPRSLDAMIKPEISAPGLRIISARVGSGTMGTRMGGTSMSAPHMAGVMALLKQHRTDLTAHQLKALVMNTSTLMDDELGALYPISRQGAGRVQAYKAATAPLLLSVHALSLGEVQVETQKLIRKEIKVTNISADPVDFSFSVVSTNNISVTADTENTHLEAGENTNVTLSISIDATDKISSELDAFLQVKSGGEIVAQLPIMAVVNHITRIQSAELKVRASNIDEANGAAVDLILTNNGLNAGEAQIFNLLGQDKRKVPTFDPFLSLACDMESSGYRVVERDGKQILQVGVKIFNPVNSWGNCFVAVEIDNNNDKVADQEIYGTSFSRMPGIGALGLPGTGSMLFDSAKLREISKQHDLELAGQPADPPALDYLPALQAVGFMNDYSHSTVTIVEAALDAIVQNNSGELKLRVMVSYNGGSVVEEDDFLSGGNDNFKTINLKSGGSGYHNIPEGVVIPAGGSAKVKLTKGDKKKETLVVYYPRNRFILALSGKDGQAEKPKPIFDFAEVLNL